MVPWDLQQVESPLQKSAKPHSEEKPQNAAETVANNGPLQPKDPNAMHVEDEDPDNVTPLDITSSLDVELLGENEEPTTPKQPKAVVALHKDSKGRFVESGDAVDDNYIERPADGWATLKVGSLKKAAQQRKMKGYTTFKKAKLIESLSRQK